MALPLGRHRLNRPTQPPGRPIYRLIRTTRIAVQEQMHRPSPGGPQQRSRNPGRRPGQIPSSTSDHHAGATQPHRRLHGPRSLHRAPGLSGSRTQLPIRRRQPPWLPPFGQQTLRTYLLRPKPLWTSLEQRPDHPDLPSNGCDGHRSRGNPSRARTSPSGPEQGSGGCPELATALPWHREDGRR